MKLDVIIPTFYKKKDILEYTVNHNLSLLNKLNFNFIYNIVVDYHPLYDSKLEYYNINKISNKINFYFKYNKTGHKESFRCINLGFYRSKSKMILIMDDDYLLSENYCEKIKNQNDCVFLSSFLRYSLEDNKVIEDFICMDPYKVKMSIGSGPPKLINRNIVNEIGLYNNNFYGYMFCDNDFSVRYKDVPHDIWDGKELNIKHIEHDHFLFGEKIDLEKLHLKYFDKNKNIFDKLNPKCLI